MSKQQWGHGFHKGYREGQIDAEIQGIFDANINAHWVPVKYERDGTLILPTEPMLCKYPESSCQSDSGGCLGFTATSKDGNYTLCIYDYPLNTWDGV